MSKILFILTATTVLTTAGYGKNLLKNTKFSKLKDQFPAHWYFGKYSGAQAEAKLDNQLFRSGKNSVRIVKSNNKGWVQLYQTIRFAPLPKPKKVKLSAWIYSEKTAYGSLVVMGNSATKRNIIWKSLKGFSGSFEWRKIEGTALVPATTNCLTISVRLSKKGLIWVDDCSMEFQNPAIRNTAELLSNPVLTGKLDTQTKLPAGWHKEIVDGYENVSKIQVVDGKPAKLKITWISGGAKFGAQASTSTPLKPGNYIFSAKFKTSKASKAQLSAGNYHSKQLASDSWKNISLIFKVNPGETINPICWNLGPGSIEYTNFSLKTTNAKVADTFPIKAIVMPVEITSIWKGKKEFYTFPSTPVPLSFEFKGDKSKFKNAALVIELPADLKVTEAYNMHTGLTQVESPQTISTKRNKRLFKRYTFTNPRVFRIIQKKSAWERKLALVIEPAIPQLKEKTFPVYWYMTADNKKSPEHNFTLHMLPDMKSQSMPENFPIYSWSLLDINFADKELLKRVASGIEKSGMNYRKRGSSPRYKKIDKALADRGWTFYVTNPDYYYLRFCNIKKSPIESKVKLSHNYKGDALKHKLCPTYFNTNQEFKKHFYKFLHDKYTKYGLQNGDPIIYDQEPWEPMEWCFCAECRKAFARKNKLKEVPSAEEIRKNYTDQWSKFRCAQTAETLKIMSEFFRLHYPKSKIYDYDYVVDFRNPGYRNFYKAVAKDPQLNEKHFDGHFASYYHFTDKNASELIDVNIKNLKKDYFVVAALDRLGYLNSNEVLSPTRMRMLLLASAASGAKGFSVYPGEHFDGLYLQMLNKTMPLVAKLENYFQKGKRIDRQIKATPLPFVTRKIKIGNKTKIIVRPNWKDYFCYRAHEKSGNIVMSLFNYNKERPLFTKISLKLPAARYTILNIDTGKRLVPNPKDQYWKANQLSSIIAKSNPMNATFLLIRKYIQKDNSIPSVTVDSLKNEFARLKAKSTDSNIFKPKVSGDMKIEADDIDNNGQLEIVLSSKSQKIWIDPALSAGIVRWENEGKKSFGWNLGLPQSSRILCTERFWLPKKWRGAISGSAFKLKSSKIADHTAILEFERVLRNKQLVLTKAYSLSGKSNSLSVEYRLRNTGPAPCTFSLWTHSYPTFGAKADIASTAITVDSKSGLQKIFNQHISKFYPFAPSENIGFSEQSIGSILKSNKVCATDVTNKNSITISLSPQQVSGVYIWCSTNPTLEWIFRPATVAPGKEWKSNFSLTAVK